MIDLRYDPDLMVDIIAVLVTRLGGAAIIVNDEFLNQGRLRVWGEVEQDVQRIHFEIIERTAQ